MSATISPVEAKIGQIIKDFSAEASFTAEAMKQFMELKAMVNGYEDEIKTLKREREVDRDKIGDLNSNFRALEGATEERDHEIEGWKTREGELKDREDNCLRHELEAQYNKVRVDDHQSMVGLIFRNTELRKTFVGQELNYQPGCVEIRDEFGNIKQYAEQAGFVGTPIEKTETTEEK